MTLARALVVSLAVALAGTAPRQEAGVVRVTVDPAVRHQTIAHFGVSWRTFDDPHLFETRDPATGRPRTRMAAAEEDAVFDLLFGPALQLRHLRLVTDGNIEVSRGRFTFEDRFDVLVDDALRARARGPVTVALTVGRYPPEKWMRGTVREYADYFVALVERARSRGLLVDYLVMNEPRIDGPLIRDIVKAVGRRVPDTITWAVTDEVKPSRAIAKLPAILEDADARRHVAAISVHLYHERDPAGSLAAVRELADRYGLPLWMTEYSGGPWGWAALQTELLTTYRMSSVSYMWGFFGAWDGAHLVAGVTDEEGRYQGMRPLKVASVFAHWSRFVPPGSTRIEATSTAPDVMVSAFDTPEARVVVVFNRGGTRRVELQVPGARQLSGVRTTNAEDLADTGRTPLEGGRATVTLPARSLTTFVGAKS
ncbi:MAG TPA: glycoside hydrolase family 30 beta sandwich domain-containing protein [Vicinamibacterales bacterium]|nr:glycoside hydrolase family 30 beta sandwich domain-containing protein [Vicinamibacterales bacterium]